MVATSETNVGQPRGRVWRNRIIRYGPLLLWLGLIFFASTGEFSAENTSLIIGPLLHWLFPNISDERVQLVHFIVRKLAHFSEYAVLALLAARAFINSSHDAINRNWFLISLLLIAVYALSDEFHQSFVATRTASIYDSMIDSSGGLVALLLLAWRRRRMRGARKVENERAAL
ncbi:MAG TPA: VanZ family protein [Pyrinomonadaceae bacterium]|nr:VanZ family protein [Pyrinomonadaceae bacterium]